MNTGTARLYRVSLLVKSLFLGLWSLTTVAFAGSGGSISGRVTDPAGRSISGSRIELRESSTNQVYSAHADSDGRFKLPLLPAGRYTLTAIAPGFAAFRRTDIVLNTDDALTLDESLSVGAVAQGVTVTDTPLHLDPENTQLGEVISAQQMTAVPLNGRSFTDLSRM